MQSLSVARKPALEPTVDRTASVAHHVVDTLADQALTGIGMVSGSAHVAVNRTADAVANAANWVAQVPQQIGRSKTRVADAALARIRARPFVTLGAVIALGFVFGRIARR